MLFQFSFALTYLGISLVSSMTSKTRRCSFYF